MTVGPEDSPLPDPIDAALANMSALQVVFWTVATVTLLVFIVKLWPAISQFVRTVNALVGLPGFMEQTTSTLKDHTSQLANSHSTNLRDDVTAALESSERTEALVKEQVLPRLDALAQSDDALWSALDDTQNPNEGEHHV